MVDPKNKKFQIKEETCSLPQTSYVDTDCCMYERREDFEMRGQEL
jgi:hypothetical protein